MKCEGCENDKETTHYWFNGNGKTYARHWCKDCLKFWRGEATEKLLQVDSMLKCFKERAK